MVAAGCAVWNGYGPTEATIYATFHRADGRDEVSVPFGTPLRGVTTYVMGTDEKPVSDGEAGELWIGGAGVALGYRGRPDLTTAATSNWLRGSRAGWPSVTWCSG